MVSQVPLRQRARLRSFIKKPFVRQVGQRREGEDLRQPRIEQGVERRSIRAGVVDQPDGQGLGRIYGPRGEQQVAADPRTDQRFEALKRNHVVGKAHLGRRRAEPGVGRRVTKVAGQREHQPAAEAVRMNTGEGRHRHRRQSLEGLIHIVIVGLSRIRAQPDIGKLLDVTPGAEGARPFAAEQQRPQTGQRADALVQQVGQRPPVLPPERVQPLGRAQR